MSPDFADREATSIIALCRSLGNAPADLHGVVAAKLRVAWMEGRLAGVTSCIAKMSREADELSASP